jgi:hypothetical protein
VFDDFQQNFGNDVGKIGFLISDVVLTARHAPETLLGVAKFCITTLTQFHSSILCLNLFENQKFKSNSYFHVLRRDTLAECQHFPLMQWQ